MKECPHRHLTSRPEPASAVHRHNRASRLIASLLVLALVALAVIACAEQNARISFISDRDGNEEIYVMNADGSDVARLTHTDGHIVGYPRWSPDGQRIAFTSDQNGNNDIYVVNADGSGLTQLTHSDSSDADPAWSPDGQRIAFTSGRLGDIYSYLANAADSGFTRGSVQIIGAAGIYLVNADGSGLTKLTDDSGTDFAPRWSPDGQRIVFVSDRDGDPDIYMMNADGPGLTQLTHSRQLELSPGWSPDGQRITFYKWPLDGKLEMYTMNADGSGLITQLTHSVEIKSFHSFPVFSPDGQHVVRVVRFADPDGDDEDEIYLANPDGSDLTQLTVADSYQGPRDEQPVVFSTTTYDLDGDDEIYIMNPDGSGLVRLTDNTSRDFAPDLAPAP